MTQAWSDFDDDNAFAERSIPAWEETLTNAFGSDLVHIEFRKEIKLQKQFWDILLFFDEGIIKKIDVKSRRIKWVHYFEKDSKRVIETQGNIESGSLGSSVFNSKAEYWATGFFNEKEILYPFIFDRQGVAEKIKYLMRWYPNKYKEIINKPTGNLYHSAFVLVEQKHLEPYRLPKTTIGSLDDWL